MAKHIIGPVSAFPSGTRKILEIAGRSARVDADTDTARSERRRGLECGPVPANDAIARDVA